MKKKKNNDACSLCDGILKYEISTAEGDWFVCNKCGYREIRKIK